MDTPKISILMPVYNVENYLRAALDSVLNQTLRDIELICVEDGSTDGSLAILEEYAARDGRVRVLLQPENKGLVCARKRGIREARGQYILFLDSDDELLPDACETVWNEMQLRPVDVLQFNTEVVACGAVSEEERAYTQKILRPYTKMLSGEDDLIKAGWQEDKWTGHIWNKAYPAALCKQAEAQLEEQYINIAEDEYISFILLYFAQSYRGIPKALHRYYLGRGMTGGVADVMRRFHSQCDRAKIYPLQWQFLREQQAESRYGFAVEKRQNEAVSDAVWTWRRRLSQREASLVYDELLQKCGAVPAVSMTARNYWNDEDELLRRIVPAGSPKTGAPRPVKHLAVYAGGSCGNDEEGRQELALLLSLWAEMGYRVTLVTDEPPCAPDQPDPAIQALPNGADRVTLPGVNASQGEAYARRAQAWQELVERCEIDTVLHCDWRSPLFFWDACLLKGLACNLVVQAREAFSAVFAQNVLQGATRVSAVRLADAVAAPPAFAEGWRNLCPAYSVEPSAQGEQHAACKAAWQALLADVGSGAAQRKQPDAEQRMVELWLEDLQRGASREREQTERLLNSKFHTAARIYWKYKDKGLAAVQDLRQKLRR